MRMRKLLVVGLILLTATVGFAQSAKIKGKVLDTSGLIMPGVTVKAMQGTKVVKEGITTATGDFELAVNPGDYKVEVSAPDFETQTVSFKATAANQPAITVKLALAMIATAVDVTEDSGAVSLDADSSLSTTTLAGDSISELPDDETELAAYLQQIAGSRGGADQGGGAGGFVIDGFSGGKLPPKDQIQEIRINNNPYSTEFSGIGFGRVEIITRAGTGNYNGSMQFNFKDESLDARNPNSLTRPPYQTRNFNTNYGGPIIKNKLTMNFRANNKKRKQWCDQGDSGRWITLPSGLCQSQCEPWVQYSRAICDHEEQHAEFQLHLRIQHPKEFHRQRVHASGARVRQQEPQR